MFVLDVGLLSNILLSDLIIPDVELFVQGINGRAEHCDAVHNIIIIKLSIVDVGLLSQGIILYVGLFVKGFTARVKYCRWT